VPCFRGGIKPGGGGGGLRSGRKGTCGQAAELGAKQEAFMNENLIHVGIDNDGSYHVVALNRRTAEVVDVNCRPTLQAEEG
jgi:hypothetical protein